MSATILTTHTVVKQFILLPPPRFSHQTKFWSSTNYYAKLQQQEQNSVRLKSVDTWLEYRLEHASVLHKPLLHKPNYRTDSEKKKDQTEQRVTNASLRSGVHKIPPRSLVANSKFEAPECWQEESFILRTCYIRHHCIKFSRHGDPAPTVGAPLP